MNNLPGSQLDEEVARLQQMLDALREARQSISRGLDKSQPTPPPDKQEITNADDESFLEWIGKALDSDTASAIGLGVAVILLLLILLARGG